MPWLLAMSSACSPSLYNEDELAMPCVVETDKIDCPHATQEVEVGLADWSTRDVHFQIPSTNPPEGGWPAVIFFQGSFISAGATWTAEADDRFGGFHLARTYHRLLEDGFAIITPETRLGGKTFWDTNQLAYRWSWEFSDDHELVTDILKGIEDGTYGDINPNALYAMGISSGGYMTSRMAVSYEGRFRALAIEGASYATCSGLLCSLPDSIVNHPPTLFLHGEGDLIVPIGTARDYHELLREEGTESMLVVDPDAGHAWLRQSPEEIARWFATH